MLSGDHQDWITLIIAKKTGLPAAQISPDSRLLQDLGVTGDDAAELLAELSAAFEIDMGGFQFGEYFTGEPHLFNWWLAGKGAKLTPITVRDLVDAARRKKWIKPATP